MNKISENVVMFIVLLLGVTLVVANFMIDSAIGSCGSATITRCNKAVLILGTVSIVASCSYMIARTRCDCGEVEHIDLTLFMTLITALGTTLITLGSVIHSSSDSTKNSNVEACKKAAKYAPIIWVTGVLMLLLGLTYWLL